MLYICYFIFLNYENIINLTEVFNYMMLYDVEQI